MWRLSAAHEIYIHIFIFIHYNWFDSEIFVGFAGGNLSPSDARI